VFLERSIVRNFSEDGWRFSPKLLPNFNFLQVPTDSPGTWAIRANSSMVRGAILAWLPKSVFVGLPISNPTYRSVVFLGWSYINVGMRLRTANGDDGLCVV
jgi:hypothetical protein